MPMAVGDGDFTALVVPLVPAATAGTPTPDATEPAVVWPSEAEVVRQVVVYTPLSSVATGTLTCVGCPGTLLTAPDSSCLPEASRMWTVVSFRSGTSVKVSSTCVGEVSTLSPSAGVDATRSAW